MPDPKAARGSRDDGFKGFGAPWTASGASSPYGPLPWRMTGRAIALWYRLREPAEARRQVPDECEMDADPVVRARFWDMRFDPGLDVPPGAWRPFREAVVAFPVRCTGVEGDFTTHMVGDNPIYNALGREVMGWPLPTGDVEFDAAAEPAPGDVVRGTLTVDGESIMRAAITLDAPLPPSGTVALPRWIGWKVIPDVDGTSLAIDQITETGPSAMERRSIWKASGSLEFGERPGADLGRLRPREVVAAEYWSGISLVIGPGRVLIDRLAAREVLA